MKYGNEDFESLRRRIEILEGIERPKLPAQVKVNSPLVLDASTSPGKGPWGQFDLASKLKELKGMAKGYPFESGDRATIILPSGSISPVVMETDTGRGAGRVGMNWLGKGTLVLRGQGRSTTSLAPSSAPSGATVAINTRPSWSHRKFGSDPSWEGRVHLADMTIECSPLCAIQTMGGQDRAPYRDVTLKGVRMIDNVDVTVNPKWGLITHQAAVSMLDCVFDLRRVLEHTHYEHQPCGDSVVHNVTSMMSGANFWQSVSRMGEGPTYGRTKATFKDCTVRDWSSFPNRASNAFTFGGSDRDVDFERVDVYDINGTPHSGNRGYGCLVVWDDTRGRDGVVNGNFTVADSIMGALNQNRACIDVQSAESFMVRRSLLFGGDLEYSVSGVGSFAHETTLNSPKVVIAAASKLGINPSDFGRLSKVVSKP